MALNQNAKTLSGLFLSFVTGERLVDGGDLKNLINILGGNQDALVALAGGGAAGATKLIYGSNRIITVAADNDSVILPQSIGGASVAVVNDGAHTLAVFPAQNNPNNGNVADAIAPHNTSVYGASTTIAAGLIALFSCPIIGKWKTLLGA